MDIYRASTFVPRTAPVPALSFALGACPPSRSRAATAAHSASFAFATHGKGFVTLPLDEREVSAPQELSSRRDCIPPCVHRRGAAADQGDAAAQNNLGRMYDGGHGVPQDYAQAVVWLRKAAEQGSALGQVNLGTMYDHGHGVPQDYAQAHMWYNLAASSAEDDAARNEAAKVRDLVATKMTPAQIAEAQRMAREWMQSHPSKR